MEDAIIAGLNKVHPTVWNVLVILAFIGAAVLIVAVVRRRGFARLGIKPLAGNDSHVHVYRGNVLPDAEELAVESDLIDQRIKDAHGDESDLRLIFETERVNEAFMKMVAEKVETRIRENRCTMILEFPADEAGNLKGNMHLFLAALQTAEFRGISARWPLGTTEDMIRASSSVRIVIDRAEYQFNPHYERKLLQ